MLAPWQWFIGANEFVVAWYVTIRFLVWRRHRAVLYDEREGQPLTEHLRWIAKQDGLVTGEDGRDYRLPMAYKCAQCGRMGSLGSRSAIGGKAVWLCVNCVNERLPEKAARYQQAIEDQRRRASEYIERGKQERIQRMHEALRYAKPGDG